MPKPKVGDCCGVLAPLTGLGVPLPPLVLLPLLLLPPPLPNSLGARLLATSRWSTTVGLQAIAPTPPRRLLLCGRLIDGTPAGFLGNMTDEVWSVEEATCCATWRSACMRRRSELIVGRLFARVPIGLRWAPPAAKTLPLLPQLPVPSVPRMEGRSESLGSVNSAGRIWVGVARASRGSTFSGKVTIQCTRPSSKHRKHAT
mmetsp:Transcript_70754/g.202725  ORF Transcript_70754/g.202725 Transcript_70754/m.202725 type:complete len:201 (-) Transcript_70754:1353-1955(-)